MFIQQHKSLVCGRLYVEHFRRFPDALAVFVGFAAIEKCGPK